MSLSQSIRRTLYVAVFFAALQINAFAQTTPTGRQLLDSMIQALGGRVFLEAREIQTKGRFYQFARGQISAADVYADYMKFPDMDRTEFGKEKQKTIQINRGKQGWMVRQSPKKGDPEVQEQSPADVEHFLLTSRTSFDYVMRFVVNTPQASVLGAGTEMVDFKRTDVLEVRDSEKNLIRIFIDRETHLPLKTQTRYAGQSAIYEDVLANWHRFDGVLTPLMVVRYKDGAKTMEIRTESVEYNVGFPDSLFSPPASSK